MKYDVDTGKGSPLPLEHVKNPTISEDRQWFSYLEWPPGTTGAAASVPGIAKVSDLTQHHALPGTGPGTDCETSNRATWSPDGQRLAMVCPAQPGVPAHLLVMDRDGENRVDAADDVCCGLTWIDDHTIVVGRKTSSGSELGEVSADGDGQWEPEVSGGGFFHDPDWSDGGLVYVHSEHSPNQSGEIQVASSLSAADVENATVWSSSGDFPAWDPSGTRLAYLKTDSRTRKDAVYQLYIAAGPYRGVLAEIEPGALGAPAWGSR
jgi:dipeptidyl aminopeptidase/acylaminoacyl peptidase